MTLPAMSKAPYGEALLCVCSVAALAAVVEAGGRPGVELLRADEIRIRRSIALPHGYRRWSVPRAAFSHSASVGSRYFFPVFALSQLQYAVAESQFTPSTGYGRCRACRRHGCRLRPVRHLVLGHHPPARPELHIVIARDRRGTSSTRRWSSRTCAI